MSGVINLFVIIAVGVMLGNMIINPTGTKALFDGMTGLWKVGVNGMLGQPTK